MDLRVGDEVYWNDPDCDRCSGYYEIVEIIESGIVRLRNGSGSETEAFVHELS